MVFEVDSAKFIVSTVLERVGQKRFKPCSSLPRDLETGTEQGWVDQKVHAVFSAVRRGGT